MDLLGMEVRERRRKAKVTILRRPNGSWSQADVSILMCLGPMIFIHGHPRHPNILMIREAHEKSAIAALLVGKDDFEHEIITGYDSPSLPFPVPTL
ncbi:MAG TPA: hypothetical protein VKT78_00340 [Fimbriimonadaceae bacterium]|nr:hypothetical protein [Fimbriimonadaceae bacterium]